MKRLCLWLTRLYPRAWRARYGVEYEELLRQWEHAGPGDATDMLLHCLAVWCRSVYAAPQRFATMTALALLLTGLACAVAATQGSVALWQSSGLFSLLALAALPAACAAGVVTARRTGAVHYGLTLVSLSLLVPAAALWMVSLIQAAGAQPLPIQNMATPAAVAALDQEVLYRQMLQSREFALHWGRFSIWAACLAALLSWPLGWLCVQLDRRWRAFTSPAKT
ncbi:MAG: hypothetical protein JNK87_05145 [Bryobacterales bacterium]|nr:hypothetical protein [Bryobacterales bacterium]